MTMDVIVPLNSREWQRQVLDKDSKKNIEWSRAMNNSSFDWGSGKENIAAETSTIGK